MAEPSLPLPGEWRQLRSLCVELPHGPARDALVALLDGVAADMRERRLRATLLAPSAAPREQLERWMQGLLAEPLPDPLPALLVLSPQPGGRSARVAHATLDEDAAALGIGRLTLACDGVAALASPLLAGHLAMHTDVLVIAGAAGTHPVALAGVA
ncbi:MAG TPA: hypothetical protein VFJ62_04255, partial [Usitatibacter sp.]|nr:hypothetical protein [Usitatibacter sp.]